ncbi:hypothetical protein [Streptomyces sp. KMM 9044]|uniref:hypothetical protein n=1 Tax=Streptomyces sp. KMM 9044 TaxID=2744474 RepID=UPI002150B864|nr:hypothetical protein [Streptomyces sp. KMM 9044]WAX78854.1 hypothetical protein HUV60_015335 [Streptomyces sp. KMM 9044]
MTSKKSHAPASADPAAKPKRRTFTPEYKLRIVAEYDAAAPGEKGAILRREALYSSHVIEWRQARDAGALEHLVDRRTSPARPKKPQAEFEVEKLRKRIERLEKELTKKAAVLREAFPRGLRGPTVALTYALKRGVKHGWWPEGTEAPVTVVYGGGPQDGWRQAAAYEMSGEDLAVFRTAFAHSSPEPRTAWDEDVPSALAPHPGWAPDADVPNAFDMVADEPPASPNFPNGTAR